MKLLKFALAFAFILTTLSCKGKTEAQPEVQSQMQKVLAIHDEVMPKMGTIGNLISRIDEKIKETDSTEALLNASQDLKYSHKAMMDWMKTFGERFDSDEILKGKALSNEKQKYLDEEEIKVKALRDKINSSINNAQELLE
jgi:outer membrane translocation and assembly module TamA